MIETAQECPRTASRDSHQARLRALQPLSAAALAAVVLGFLVRAFYIFTEDFPLNDGGLFYLMTQELQRANYRLPAFTGYNAADIPFAYPPLGFYLAGLIDDFTPLQLLDVFRLLPLLATSLTLVAVYRLARELLPSVLAAVIATFAFAFTPRSFVWLLMGGGVTRSLGLLFAVLALWQLYLLYTRHRARYALTTTLCAALTVLSHLETAQFLAFSAALFFLAYGRHRHGLLTSVAIAIGTVALTAPWWGTVLWQHGVGPFLNARATGQTVFADPGARNTAFYTLARFGDAGEPFFPLARMLGLLGALVVLTDTITAALDRRLLVPLLPLWWAMLLFVDPRAAATYMTVPMSLLAGIGVGGLLLRAMRDVPEWAAGRQARIDTDRSNGQGGQAWNRGRIWAVLLLAFLLGYGLLAATLPKRPQVGGEAGVLISLSRDERAAMEWIARETPADSRFLVISGGPWPINRTAEWFPALTGRVSVTTVQGSEWLPDHAFTDLERIDGMAQECAGGDTSCLTQFSAETSLQYEYVYVRLPMQGSRHPANQCCQLAVSLAGDPAYTRVYSSPGAQIYARR